FASVEFAYRAGEEVLRGIDFDVAAGRRVAIVGASGSGKSTLLSLTPRLFDPTSGTVEIDGESVRSFTLESLRSQISLVLQDSVLFGLSIAENIRYGCPEASDDELVAAAQAARIHDFVISLPEGYGTVVSERG